jgi:aspartate 1-decarboxylase
MQHIMLLAKLHRVTVTEAALYYEGSCGIDEELLDAAKMHEFEKIEIYNINNGERFSTYIIKAARGSGVISLNGAAARRAHVGDHLIICTYGDMDANELATHIPTVVLVGEGNKAKEVKSFKNQNTSMLSGSAIPI